MKILIDIPTEWNDILVKLAEHKNVTRSKVILRILANQLKQPMPTRKPKGE
jgi:hypothetical protein